MSARTALAASALVAATLAGVPSAAPDRSPAKLLASASGGLILTNTNDGEPIVSADAMYPGDRVRGVVRIGNASFDRAGLVLVPRFRDRPGPNGGELSKALRVTVERIRLKRAKHPRRTARRFRRVTRTLYRGRLKKIDRLRAGSLGPFKGNRYRITVRLPDRGTPKSATAGDNSLQGSRASLNLIWRAR